ncbi:MAG TPA: S53 family peptidase [Candidatus Acidoferrales bacterium]|nr:S53 family peptidase [Candidatus Acidoferrales bacterium]
MQIPNRGFLLFASCAALLALASLGSSGQNLKSASHLATSPAQNASHPQFTVMRGNTSPLARPEDDRGPAPSALPMDHMRLVLRRGPRQEAALEALMARQQDRSSPDFHHWLTPAQFGRQFGPSDQDIQTITNWLGSQGFQVNAVSNGRTVIDFSGIAAQVQSAFHTAIHRYSVNGEDRWSNASDPMIPTALAPMIAGVVSLNNFRRRPLSHSAGIARRARATGKFTRLNPQFTYPSGCASSSSGCNLAIGPYDFAQQYNLQPLWQAGIDGAGVTIAIVGDSNINLQDAADFRGIFGLPANAPKVTIVPPPLGDSTDPGVNADEGEAILDVEWAGAVATGATVNLVIADNTNSSNGVDTAAEYVVDNAAASVLSESFGACEAQLGSAGNAFYTAIWQQAASEGISVVAASGDEGPAGCDPGSSSPAPAQFGLAVSGIASTPYDVAVGGTDFDDYNNPALYWSATNTPVTQASLLSYVPEVPYSDSCANSILATIQGAGFSGNAEADCNDSAINTGLIEVVGSGGGPSSCTGGPGGVNTCTAGAYPKPSWQAAPGVPADGARDIPDVSLFAGDGLAGSFYIVCQSDQTSGAACSLNSPYNDFVGFGGTSVSTQAFAGVMALVDQAVGAAQGNPNPTLYALANEQDNSACNATGAPGATCIFNDVTAGSTAVPCQPSTPNCTRSVSTDSYGIITSNGTPAYAGGVGYDLATGLGSVNITNLVDAWGPNFSVTSQNPSVTIATAGGSDSMSVTVSALNGFTGQVSLSCSGLPAGYQCSFNPASAILTSTTASVPVTVGVGPASALVPPTGSSPRSPWWFATGLAAALLLLLAAFYLAAPKPRRAWAFGFAVLSFSLLVMIGCSGKSKSSGGGGTTTTATLVGTAPSGSTTVTYSLNFTVKTP